MLEQPKRTQLNRALSKLGLCSRKIADGWIASGRVSVNGEVEINPEQWVDLSTDQIVVDGLEQKSNSEKKALVYLAMHKPRGFVTTRSDELGRKTIYDLLPPPYASKEQWIFPVGRLDLESEGLLFLTNDGEWSDLLTDPKFHLEKVYHVKLDGKPLENELEKLRTGIFLEEKKTLPARVEILASGWYQVGIIEGRNRQIRKMFHSLGYKVKRLMRVSMGDFQLGALPVGETRVVDSESVESLRLAALKEN